MNRPTLLAALGSLALISACSPPAQKTETPVATPAAEAPVAQAAPAIDPAVEPAVDPALDAYVRTYAKDDALPLRYASATHGEGEAQLTFVYLIGPEYCGSAGCSLLVLHRTGDTFDLLGKVSTVDTPVRVLETTTNGRPDLAIRTRGEGVSIVDKLIPFDGRRYLWSPNVAGARDIQNPGGQIVLTDDTPKVTVRAQ